MNNDQLTTAQAARGVRHMAQLFLGIKAGRDWLTTAQAARLLQVDPSRVRQLASRLNGEKAGRDWLFTRDAIEQYARTRRVGRPRKEAPRG